MRHLPALIAHEVRTQFYSPATYAAAVLFLLCMGSFYLVSLTDAARMPQENTPSEVFLSLFWFPVLFMVPMLTMRSFAEERRLGTLETLLTTPVSSFEVVFSKFFGAYVLYAFLWALTLIFPFCVQWVSPASVQAGALLEPATLIGGYCFIALTGVLYTAVGVFTSSLTRSQLIAGMLSFCILFIFIMGARMLTSIPLSQNPEMASLDNIPDYLRTFRHLEDFTHGIVDSRPFFFYLSNAILLLAFTSLIIRNKA